MLFIFRCKKRLQHILNVNNDAFNFTRRFITVSSVSTLFAGVYDSCPLKYASPTG